MNMADQEKKMTKYDLKQQRRQEEKKDGGSIKLLGFACVAFLAFCIGVFAFQTFQSQKEKSATYVTIGEHEIKKAEYDYYFYGAVNTLYSYYGTYLNYMGLDLTQDFRDGEHLNVRGTDKITDYLAECYTNYINMGVAVQRSQMPELPYKRRKND